MPFSFYMHEICQVLFLVFLPLASFILGFLFGSKKVKP